MRIILGDIDIEAPKGLELVEPARVVSHPIEKGFDITDHTALEPRQFRITATFWKPNLYVNRFALYRLQAKREPFKIITPLLSISNVLILKLSTTHSPTHIEVKVVIDIKEIRTADTQTILLEEAPGDVVIDPFDGGIGDPTEDPETPVPPDDPEDEGHWYDKFITPVTNFWGGLWGG